MELIMIQPSAAAPVSLNFTAWKFLPLIAVFALLVSRVADADTADDWYISGALTGSFLKKPDQTIANAPTPGATLHVTNDVDSGWGGQVAIGRSLGAFRLEAEVGRTENDSNTYTATSPIHVTLPQDGKNNATRYMANAYYDFPQGTLPVKFYIGLGAGAADAHVTTFAAPARAPAAPPSQLLDIKQTVFAYQLMGGLSHMLTERVGITMQYRWFDAGTIKGHDARGERATREMAGSNVDIGLRVLF
jgi:opacity protein-like surface antigen